MAKYYYELDPHGDVVFLFPTIDPDAAKFPDPKAVRRQSATPAQVTDGSVGSSSTSVTGTKAQGVKQKVGHRKLDTPEDTSVVGIRVSSKHLSLASPVFEKMFHGLWKEAQCLHAGHVEIEMDWQNMDAMLILMNVIHGHGPDVPRNVSLEMLTEISILVDYYNCHKAIQLAVDQWIRPLLAAMAEEFCDDIVRWIWISWVLRLADTFRSATHCAVTQSKGPISSLGLPIHHRLIDAIEKRREYCIKSTLEALRRLVTDLRDGEKSCSFECDSIRLGALTKQLQAQVILWRLHEDTIPSISLDELKDFLINIKSPAWREVTPNPPPRRRTRIQAQHSENPCTLQSMIKPILSNMANHMKGYEYGDFKQVP
ncbi:hypothetical protein CNMCM5793_009355 [Aspergillus hiratsukae]|uniref:BTB domain-containing protein n=1 Tax=Aspergillus hiratsukae TaxID=1194566 RepID=A0A8H6QCX4_9EURO|nr:hypothetical protein CNMCM5793_009355 [Aspergillus hiratsukae]KAF7171375.1 hypothetical protein CNMCM6106_005770 [Aspergillus hiratsukae]